MSDKIIYPFKKSDGFYVPCCKGCTNCTHCTDVIWDYSHGVYHVGCELHEDHDVICPDYNNDGNKPVSIIEFNIIKLRENSYFGLYKGGDKQC